MKNEVTAPETAYEISYFAVINENGEIQFANESLYQCLHIETNNQRHRQLFNFLSKAGNSDLRKALQLAGFASNPYCLQMDLLNSHIHKAAWYVARLKTTEQRPHLFMCIGNQTDYEKPTNKNEAYDWAIDPAFGIVIQDAGGNVIDANSKAIAFLNPHPVKDWISCESHPPMKALLSGRQQQQIITTGTPSNERTLLINSYPLFDDTTTVPFSIITVIKEFLQPQPAANPELDCIKKEFQNRTTAMQWLIDTETEHLIHANPAFLRFAGLTEQHFNQSAMEVIPPPYPAALEKKHREVAVTGMAHKKVYKLPMADGTTRYFQVHLFRVPNSYGRLLVGGEAVDVTVGYEEHEEVVHAYERLLRLTRVTSEAVWEWDLQTNQVYRNQTLQDLIGSPEGEMLGLSWWFDRIHPDDRERVEALCKRILTNKVPTWNNEYRFLCAQGTYRMVRDRGFAIYENDQPIKLMGSVTDITELKELELQLVQEKIKHQKAIAKSIIATQEKVYTKIGQELHDNVNQLLLVTKLYVGLLKLPDDYNREITGKIMESLSIAITDIQTMSRQMVLPKLTEKSLPESINKLVTDVKITGQFDIKFVCTGHFDDRITRGKKVALYRILQEHFKNIIQYSQAKKVTVALTSASSFLELKVCDDGIGFDPLKKTQGIGLRNIYDRTELYNGTVELNAAPGKGCQLTIRIPRLPRT